MKVGICWIIDGTVVADTVALEDVRHTDSYTISHGDHFSYWKNLSPKTEWERKLKDSEWDYYPRCTVVYLQPADDKDLMNRFCVIYDRCIDDSSLQQVYTEFQLAIDSTLQIQTSARYRCSTCSPAHAILSAADNQPGTPFEFAYHWCKRIESASRQLSFLRELAVAATTYQISEKILDECSEIAGQMLQSVHYDLSHAVREYSGLADTCIKLGFHQKANQMLLQAIQYCNEMAFRGNITELSLCASVARKLPQQELFQYLESRILKFRKAAHANDGSLSKRRVRFFWLAEPYFKFCVATARYSEALKLADRLWHDKELPLIELALLGKPAGKCRSWLLPQAREIVRDHVGCVKRLAGHGLFREAEQFAAFETDPLGHLRCQIVITRQLLVYGNIYTARKKAETLSRDLSASVLVNGYKGKASTVTEREFLELIKDLAIHGLPDLAKAMAQHVMKAISAEHDPWQRITDISRCRLPELLIHAGMTSNAEKIIDEYLACNADQMNTTPGYRNLFATLMYTFALCFHHSDALWNEQRRDSFQRLLGAFPWNQWPI